MNPPSYRTVVTESQGREECVVKGRVIPDLFENQIASPDTKKSGLHVNLPLVETPVKKSYRPRQVHGDPTVQDLL